MNALLLRYRYPFGCIIFGIIAGLIFFILGVTRTTEWFSRGASVIVLFGAAAEYGLIQIQSQIINDRIAGMGGLSGPLIENFDISAPFPALKILAHMCVILGTLIWGFGDWYLSWLLCDA